MSAATPPTFSAPARSPEVVSGAVTVDVDVDAPHADAPADDLRHSGPTRATDGPRPPGASTAAVASAGHMPQLDALRAIAVLGVLVQHFVPNVSKTFHWGDIGVQLFFVLSGFLITGILLRCRDLAERGRASGGRDGYGYVLRHFYARRALRLFPAFYLSIALAYLTARALVPDGAWWHMVYLSNVKMTMQAGWDGIFSHYWSLSVEEQFYLVWPCLIFFLPRAALLPVIALAIGIAPAQRALTAVISTNTIATFAPTSACLDALGCGSLLAILHARRRPDGSVDDAWRRPLQMTLLCGALPMLVAVGGLQFFWKGYVLYAAIFNTLLAVMFMLLVDKAARGFGGWTGRVLASRALTYPGRISYGIYVYHLLVAQWVYQAALKFGIPYEHGSAGVFFVQSALTVLVAALSWHLIEGPINSLKDRLPYSSADRRMRSARPWQPSLASIGRLGAALSKPYWWQRIGGAAVILGVILGAFVMSSEAEPPQLRDLSGTLTFADNAYSIGEQRIHFGDADYLSATAVGDLNEDGQTHPLADEIEALVGAPAQLTVRQRGDGDFDVYAVNGTFYRSAAGPPPWAVAKR